MVNAVEYGYNVYLIPLAGGYSTSRDITDFVLGIPIFTETGLEELNHAQIELRSPHGEFLTIEPIIQYHDHIRIVANDGAGNTYDREFEWAQTERSMEIVESKNVGNIITLNLQGIEYHTNYVNHVKPFYRESPFAVCQDIGETYNANRGTDQPELSGHNTSGLPQGIVNNYPYGDTPTVCLDRWKDLVQSLGAPLEVGGVLDFFTLGFNTGGDEFNKINLVAKSLGSTPTNPIRIKEGTLTVDEDERQTTFAPAKANRIIGLFGSNAGSLPTGFSKFEGQRLRYIHLPFHQNIDYRKGEEVKDPADPDSDGLYNVFRCLSDAPAGTSLFDEFYWKSVPYALYFDGLQYSEWTDDKATLWATSAIDVMNESQWGKSFPDFNLIIRNNEFFRVPVDAVVSSPTQIPRYLLYNRSHEYRGLRVLVINGIGPFVNNSNSVMQFDGTTWRVRYSFKKAGSLVFDEDTGTAYMYDGTNMVINNDGSGRDAIHHYESIDNVQGAVPNTLGMGTNQNSAIEVTYSIPTGSIAFIVSIANQLGKTAEEINTLQEAANAGFIGYTTNFAWENADGVTQTQNILWNRDFYNAGVSLRLKFPFPSNTQGGIIEDVGALYGGSNSTGREPATFDIKNNHLTHDGQRGYNNSSSEDLGTATGIGFFMRMTFTAKENLTGFNGLITRANIPVRVYMTDTSDHVVYSDIIIPRNGDWSSHIVQFGDFKPYLALKPKTVVDFIVPPIQLEQYDEFEYHNIKTIGFTLTEAFDDEGRFDTISSQLQFTAQGLANILSRPVEDYISALAGFNVKMAIDGFRFVKQLVVVSDVNEKFNQESKITDPDTVDYSSGEYFIKSEEEKLRFPKKNVINDVRGRFDVHYGDSIIYENPKVITDSDSGPNSIRLAVQSIEHSITTQGFRSRLYVNKRFEA